jgi:hypothetical protein
VLAAEGIALTGVGPLTDAGGYLPGCSCVAKRLDAAIVLADELYQPRGTDYAI